MLKERKPATRWVLLGCGWSRTYSKANTLAALNLNHSYIQALTCKSRVPHSWAPHRMSRPLTWKPLEIQEMGAASLEIFSYKLHQNREDIQDSCDFGSQLRCCLPEVNRKHGSSMPALLPLSLGVLLFLAILTTGCHTSHAAAIEIEEKDLGQEFGCPAPPFQLTQLFNCRLQTKTFSPFLSETNWRLANARTPTGAGFLGLLPSGLKLKILWNSAKAALKLRRVRQVPGLFFGLVLVT